jgi:hypothetical protein
LTENLKARLNSALATSDLASGLATSIGAPGFGEWYDVEEGYYVYEPVPRLGSCEQQGVPSDPAHDQPHTLHQSSEPLHDQV